MGAASGRAFFLYVYRNKRQQSHQCNRRTGRVIRPCPQSRDQMQGPVEAVVNSCVVDLHEVPVVVRQAVFRRMVADLVQRGLVGRPGGDVGIVAHGERDAAPPLAAGCPLAVVVLYDAAANPVRRGVERKEHLRDLERLVRLPGQA